jgi:hypothetical protein
VQNPTGSGRQAYCLYCVLRTRLLQSMLAAVALQLPLAAMGTSTLIESTGSSSSSSSSSGHELCNQVAVVAVCINICYFRQPLWLLAAAVMAVLMPVASVLVHTTH